MYADGTLGNHSGQKHSTLIGNDRKDLLAVAGNSKRDTSENVHCTNTVRLQLFNILLLDEVVQWLLEILVNSLVGKDGERRLVHHNVQNTSTPIVYCLPQHTSREDQEGQNRSWWYQWVCTHYQPQPERSTSVIETGRDIRAPTWRAWLRNPHPIPSFCPIHGSDHREAFSEYPHS